MVAYSFQKRFAPQIVDGSKRQTIRAHRVRHARPGERLQLYVGMRTKSCRKIIDDPVCKAVDDIVIRISTSCQPALRGVEHPWIYVDDEFARADGFQDALDFTRFWLDTHGPGDFRGVVVRWHWPPLGGAS